MERLQSNLISRYNDYGTMMMHDENIVCQAMKMCTWYMLDEIILFKYLKKLHVITIYRLITIHFKKIFLVLNAFHIKTSWFSPTSCMEGSNVFEK